MEATRLLTNRLTGLLLARQRLRKPLFGSQDADFVGRNISKARLALGDAAMVMFGQYHWSCRERHRRLQQLAVEWKNDLLRHHAAGVEFKLHPVQADPADREELQKQLSNLLEFSKAVWLWIETKRLGKNFSSVEAYVSDSIPKLPELTHPLHNLLLSLRAKTRSSGFRHPRELLLRTLPRLLWISSSLEEEEDYLWRWRRIQ